MLADIYRDAVYAVRTLIKSPSFTAVAIFALALGIGANTTVYSVVNALLNFPVPMEDPERVTFIFSENPELEVTQSSVSMDDFLDWREQARSFDILIGGAAASYNPVGAGEPVRIQALQVSPGFFPLTGKPLTIGRAFREEESERGNHRVAVISHRYLFTADAGVGAGQKRPPRLSYSTCSGPGGSRFANWANGLNGLRASWVD